MSGLRALSVLAVIVAAALLLGGLCDWSQLPAVVATVSLGDALFGALGLVLALMTGAAGTLMAADVRADLAAARAWQGITAELAAITTPAEVVAPNTIDPRYSIAPQDETLRRILLAHRFVVPVAASTAATPLAGPCADAPPAARTGAALTDTTLQVAPADTHAGQVTGRAVVARRERRLIGSTKATGGRMQRNSLHSVPVMQRAANAGRWWVWPDVIASDRWRAPPAVITSQVIALADRKASDHDRTHAGDAPEPATTTRPACRDPPAAAHEQRPPDERQGASEQPPAPESRLREKRSRRKAPADLAVITNLPEHVPICAAELDVIETYLEDVLDDVLGDGSADPETTTT